MLPDYYGQYTKVWGIFNINFLKYAKRAPYRTALGRSWQPQLNIVTTIKYQEPQVFLFEVKSAV